jgi:hypothetical protein
VLAPRDLCNPAIGVGVGIGIGTYIRPGGTHTHARARVRSAQLSSELGGAAVPCDEYCMARAPRARCFWVLTARRAAALLLATALHAREHRRGAEAAPGTDVFIYLHEEVGPRIPVQVRHRALAPDPE